MQKIKILPPAEYLRECFSYDSETGELTWRHRPREHFHASSGWHNANRCTGKIAGNVNGRYRVVGLDDLRNILVHRIIWKLVTGEEPPDTIDHIDGDRFNNRWKNLRAATMPEQGWNSKKQVNNTSGYRGVSKNKNRWRAEICVNRQSRFLGTFNTPEEASSAYEAAAKELHGEFFRQ